MSNIPLAFDRLDSPIPGGHAGLHADAANIVTLVEHGLQFIDVQGYGAEGDGVTDDTQAILDAYADTRAGVLFFAEGSYRVTSNISLSSVGLFFADGASLDADVGVQITLGADVQPYAGDEQIIFNGAGDVVYNTNGRVCANWWGANGATDFALRINACHAGAPNARLFEYYGAQAINSTTNFTMFNDGTFRQFAFHGAFTHDVSANPVYDFTGSRNARIDDLDSVDAGLGNVPTVGVLESRLSTGAASAGKWWRNCRVSGTFTKAAHLNHACELSKYDRCTWNNTNAADLGAGFILTGINSYGVTSPFVTVLGNTLESCTVHSFDRCRKEGRGTEAAFLVEAATRVRVSSPNLLATSSAPAYMRLDSTAGGVSDVLVDNLYGEGTGSPVSKPPRVLKLDGGDCAGASEFHVSIKSTGYTDSYGILVTSSGRPIPNSIFRADGHGIEFNVASTYRLKNVYLDVAKVKFDTGVGPFQMLTGTVVTDTFADFVGAPTALAMGFTRISREEDSGGVVAGGIITTQRGRSTPKVNVTIDGSNAITWTTGFLRLTTTTSAILATVSLPAYLTSAQADGLELFVRANTGTVTIQHNTGNIHTGGQNVVIGVTDYAHLIYDNTVSRWILVGVYVRPTAQTYTNNSGVAADRTLAAYTSDPESSAYTGIDNAQVGTVYATVADLNLLRVAYENLRVKTEDDAALLSALIADLKTSRLVL